MITYNNQITSSELNKLNKTVEQFNKRFEKQVQPDEEMGKNEFLKLLTVQLSHQNPLEPMDNTAFISQMAQFSSLEQMQNVSSELRQMRQDFTEISGVNLLGKEASYVNEEGEILNGTIDKVSIQNGTKLNINGKLIELDQVISIAGEKPKVSAGSSIKN